MNLSEKQYKQRISLGDKNNSLMTLIGICLIMFILMAFLKAVWFFRFDKADAPALFDKNVLGWFSLSADPETIGTRPWTVITHMFVQDRVWIVFANMLWLWIFGYIMQDLTGNKKIIPIFIYGALAGALAFVLAYNLLPGLEGIAANAKWLGSGAGVMAVAIATTVVSPNYRLFPMIGGGLPLWSLTTLFLIIDFATIPVDDTATLLAHGAGAFMGLVFVLLLRIGYDWSDWMNRFFDWIGNLFNPDKPRKGKDIKQELFYKSSKEPFKKTPNVTQQRIDEILDKINQQGFNSLSEEEKELLRRASSEEFRKS